MVHPLFDITDKKAIVTGGTRGLGFGMAEALAEAGCEVVVIGSSDRVFETVNGLVERGYRCYAVKADLRSREENYRAFQESLELLGGDLDIMVTAAGIQRRHLPEDFPIEEWDEVMSINLDSVWIMCQEAGKIMLPKGRGKIINVASMCSYFGGQFVPAYTATKGAVMQLTRALACDWSDRGVNVNAIAPGLMDTDMNTPLVNDPESSRRVLDRIPMNRWGTPDDMKGTTIFLAAPASDYLCGAIIPVDGGYLGK